MKCFFIAALLLGLLLPGAGAADSTFMRTNQLVITRSEATEGQFFLWADAAELGGTMHDDVFAAASRQLDVTGTTLADAWLAAGTELNLAGRFRDHVRAVSRQVIVTGELDRDLHAIGNSIHLKPESIVRGSLRLAGDHVIVEGSIGSPLLIIAQSVTLAGSMDSDVTIWAQDIMVMPGTLIAGNLRYAAPKELFLDPGIQLGGALHRLPPASPESAPLLPDRNQLALKFIQFAGALLVGLPLAGLFPRVTGRATRLVRLNPLRCILAGLAALFLLPLLAVASAFTVIGLPLGLLAGGAMLAVLYAGKVVVAIALGAALIRRKGAPTFGLVASAMALGLFLLYAVSALPKLGDSLALLVAIVGSGALWWSCLRGELRPDLPPPVPEPVKPLDK